MKIRDHRIEGAPFVPTTKMGGFIVPRAIVMHFTAGWTTEGDIYTLAQSNRKASAHGVLSREGKWTQIVPFNRKAWHAGPSRYPLDKSKPSKFVGFNDLSIGIEISNIGYVKLMSNGLYMDEYGNQIRPDGTFVGSKKKTRTPPAEWPQYQHPVLSPKFQYFWEPYAPIQLEWLEEFCEEAIITYQKITDVVGHEEIDTRGWKSDPCIDCTFPMRRYDRIVEDRSDPKIVAASDTGVVMNVADGAAKAEPVVVRDGQKSWWARA